MEEAIELTFDGPSGIIDCMLEPQKDDTGFYFSATILYPNIVNGFSRSEIYCHDLRKDARTGRFLFEEGDTGLHPKIKQLEARISEAIAVTH